jgi:hypothetical protein
MNVEAVRDNAFSLGRLAYVNPPHKVLKTQFFKSTYFYVQTGNFFFLPGNLWTGPLIVAMLQDLVVPEMFLNYSLVYLHGNRSLSFELFARSIEKSQSCE